MKFKLAFWMQGFLFLATRGLANDPADFCGSRSQGLAGSRVMLADHWSGLGNPAGLAVITRPSFSICYENRFLIPEVGLGAFTGSLPVRTGTFGMGFTTFGYSWYRENHLFFSFGRNFGRKFRAGIGLHYQTIRQSSDYGNLHAVTPSLGIQVMPIEPLTLGLQVSNPAGQQYAPQGFARLPVVIQAGMGCRLGDEFMMCVEAEKRPGEKIIYRGGIEMNLHQYFAFRFGIASGEFPGYSFGLGFHFTSFRLDIAAAHHPALGFSPSVTVSFR